MYSCDSSQCSAPGRLTLHTVACSETKQSTNIKMENGAFQYIILPKVENPAVGERGWREAYLDTGEQPIELVLYILYRVSLFQPAESSNFITSARFEWKNGGTRSWEGESRMRNRMFGLFQRTNSLFWNCKSLTAWDESRSTNGDERIVGYCGTSRLPICLITLQYLLGRGLHQAILLWEDFGTKMS